MQVITGSARGRRLTTVEGTDVVRPTTQKVKEAIFSAIQFDIEGAVVLDLFAGSGQLGIEALSRGAKECTFVDSAAVSIKTIKQNVSHVGFDSTSEILNKPFSAFLKSTSKTFDLVFMDPPYGKKLVQKALPLAAEKMSERGVIVCEHEKECVCPQKIGEFSLTRVLRHGIISVSIYRKINPNDDNDEEDEI